MPTMFETATFDKPTSRIDDPCKTLLILLPVPVPSLVTQPSCGGVQRGRPKRSAPIPSRIGECAEIDYGNTARVLASECRLFWTRCFCCRLVGRSLSSARH